MYNYFQPKVKRNDNLLCSITNVFSVIYKPIFIVLVMYSECFDGRSFCEY